MCTVPNSLINLILHQPVSWIGSCNLDLDPAIRGGCRRPRCTVDGDRRPQSAKGRDRRRPKAGVGECRASRARTRAEAPIQVRKGPFDPPLCVSLLVCPSDAMLLPSSAIRHAMAPLRSAQAPCRLRPPLTNRNRFCPFPPLRSDISGHRSSSHVRALLSAAPSPETLIPPLSLALPRLPSHVPSNTCGERPLPSLPSSSPGTSTSTSAGIGNVGGGGDDDGRGQCVCGCCARTCAWTTTAAAATDAAVCFCARRWLNKQQFCL